MKVKKKYIILTTLLLFLISLILLGIGVFISQKYKISFQDGKRFVKNGFSFNPAGTNELESYISEFQKDIDILHYELKIDLRPDENIIISNIKITGTPLVKNLKIIELNFNDGFDVSAVTLNNLKSNYNYSNNRFTILSDEVIIDTFIISVNYQGKPESLGFGSFNFTEFDGEPSIYTLNEPIFASTWFPCNDMPSDKVLTDLHITNDSSMTSVSNGVLVSRKTINGRTTYHWKTKYPIATYLISIFSADYLYFDDKYVSQSNDTMNIDYYVFKDDFENAKKDFSIHNNALLHFSGLFGEYPFIEEKYGVAQFMWSLGAMENQTITGIGKNFVTGNQFFTGMLVHELAHQWWGNAVTLESWKDIWLNEGFATYSEALYWEKEKGFNALKSTMKSFNSNFNGTTLYNPDKLFSKIIYHKGAWVLHMLRRELGDEKFFNLLKTYFETYKYKNASTFDFIELVETYEERNLTTFFDQWIFNGDGKIELEYNHNIQIIGDSTKVIILVNQIQDRYKYYDFLLDFDFYLEEQAPIRKTIRVNERKNKFTFKILGNVTKIDLDPDTWLAADIKYLEQ